MRSLKFVFAFAFVAAAGLLTSTPASAISEGCLYDNGDGTIYDNCVANHYIAWKQADSGSKMTYAAAVNYCDTFDLEFEDWRLPTRAELSNLYFAGLEQTYGGVENRTVANLGNPFGFSGPLYWTSSTRQNSAAYAWYVSFTQGAVGALTKTTPLHIRCVRDNNF